ncbi:MAG: hypothetical protein K5928_02100 [Prevotella sp.]|nr:hypothetical protein [Prevotella sp.]
MNKLTLAAVAAVALTAACCRQRERIDERAAELCLYIPDHGLPEGEAQQARLPLLPGLRLASQRLEN